MGISWTDTVAPVTGQIELNAELRLSVHRVELSVLTFHHYFFLSVVRDRENPLGIL